LVLTLQRSGWGQWQALGQLSDSNDNDGLSSLIINVQALGGNLGISSSTCQLPYGTHYWLDGNVQSQLVGFTEFRSNGTNGTGICAGQKTTSLGQVVLTDVGYSAGSTPGDQTGQSLGPELISWSAPVLIASGSYSGLYGTLSVAVGARPRPLAARRRAPDRKRLGGPASDTLSRRRHRRQQGQRSRPG
jgi:hypothetical protein